MKPLICAQCGAPLAVDERKCEYCGTAFSMEHDNHCEEVILYADDQPVEMFIRYTAEIDVQAVDHLANAMSSIGRCFDFIADRFRYPNGRK